MWKYDQFAVSTNVSWEDVHSRRHDVWKEGGGSKLYTSPNCMKTCKEKPGLLGRKEKHHKTVWPLSKKRVKNYKKNWLPPLFLSRFEIKIGRWSIFFVIFNPPFFKPLNKGSLRVGVNILKYLTLDPSVLLLMNF